MIFVGSVLPLYTAIWVSGLVSTDYTKVKATYTEARLEPGNCTWVRAAFYRFAVIFILLFIQFIGFKWSMMRYNKIQLSNKLIPKYPPAPSKKAKVSPVNSKPSIRSATSVIYGVILNQAWVLSWSTIILSSSYQFLMFEYQMHECI